MAVADQQPQPSKVPPGLVAVGATGVAIGGPPVLVTTPPLAAAHAATSTADLAIDAAMIALVIRLLRRFLTRKRSSDVPWLESELQRQYPGVPIAVIRAAVAQEMKFEEQFQAKALKRVEADMVKAGKLPTPAKRRARVDAILAREKHYIMLRAQASLVRAHAAMERHLLKNVSPDGAVWELGDRKNHTPGCVALAGLALPWDVIDAGAASPVHTGCGCYLRALKPTEEPLDGGAATSKVRAALALEEALERIVDPGEIDAYLAGEPIRGVIARALEEAHWREVLHARDRRGRFVEAFREALKAGRSRAHYGGLSAHIERQGPTTRVSISGVGTGAVREIFGQRDDLAGIAEAADNVIEKERPSEPLDSTESVGVMAVRDFVGAFDGFEHGGMTAHVIHAEVKRTNYDKPDKPKKLEIQGVIHDADGNEVGMFIRNLFADRAYHNLLYINPDQRDQGFATALNQHAEQVYRQHGVKQIELRTENVGGYAWARAGYEIKQGPVAEKDPLGLFEGKNLTAAAEVLARMFRGREDKDTLEELRSHVSPALWDEFQAGFALTAKEVPTGKPGERKTIHMPDRANAASARFQKVSQVAQFGIEEPWTDAYGHMLWLGKAFLIGMEWDGVKPL